MRLPGVVEEQRQAGGRDLYEYTGLRLLHRGESSYLLVSGTGDPSAVGATTVSLRESKTLHILVGTQDPSTSTLRRGDSGVAVRELQEALAQRGYSLEVDGVFGPSTEAAVREFQTRQGLEADGIAGLSTQDALGL